MNDAIVTLDESYIFGFQVGLLATAERPQPRALQYEDLSRLPYLNMVIKVRRPASLPSPPSCHSLCGITHPPIWFSCTEMCSACVVVAPCSQALCERGSCAPMHAAWAFWEGHASAWRTTRAWGRRAP